MNTEIKIDGSGNVVGRKYEQSGADQSLLDKNFTYHPPKDNQPERYVQLRDKAKELARLMLASCPRSRELSLAMTKLEEATFWANASIARNE